MSCSEAKWKGKKIKNRICLLEQFSQLSESHTAVRNTELRTTNICFPKRPQPELLKQRQCLGIARSGNGNHVLPGPLFSCVLNGGHVCLLLGQFVCYWDFGTATTVAANEHLLPHALPPTTAETPHVSQPDTRQDTQQNAQKKRLEDYVLLYEQHRKQYFFSSQLSVTLNARMVVSPN